MPLHVRRLGVYKVADLKGLPTPQASKKTRKNGLRRAHNQMMINVSPDAP